MKRLVFGAGFRAFLLMCHAGWAKILEEILKEKGVISDADFKEATAAGHMPYTIGKGFTFTSPDGRFQLSVGGRGQFQYRYVYKDDGNGPAEDVQAWRIRRFKAYMGGYAFVEGLTYRVQADLSKSAEGVLVRRLLRAFGTALVIVFLALPSRAEERLRMSTTTSTENSGLLSVLLPPFEKECGCRVDVVAVGTGKALKLGEAGDVDVVFVHARSLEESFVVNGYGVERRDVMYNDFVLLGPPDDPAGAGNAPGAPDAFRTIASKRMPFVSRGDESGTHEKEKEIWRAAGIVPRGAWYVEAGQGMGEVLTMAAEKRGYALSDRGTYIAYRKKTDLVVLQQGDENLWNPYGIIAVNPKKYPHVKFELAMKLIGFVTGPPGRALISGYKVDGEPLYFVYGKDVR